MKHKNTEIYMQLNSAMKGSLTPVWNTLKFCICISLRYREEYSKLFDFVSAKNLKIKNKGIKASILIFATDFSYLAYIIKYFGWT